MLARCGEQRKDTDADHGNEACRRSDQPHTRAQHETVFGEREKSVDDKRKQRSGDAAEEHENPVFRLQSRENVISETRLTHRRGKRGGADHPDGSDANARKDDGRGQRQLDEKELLAARHADGTSSSHHRRIDVGKPGDRILENRQHRIERERSKRG